MNYEREMTLDQQWQDPLKPFEETVVSIEEAGRDFLGRLSQAAQRAIDRSEAIAAQVQENRIAAGLVLSNAWEHRDVIAKKVVKSAVENAPAILAGAGTRILVKEGLKTVAGVSAFPAMIVASTAGSVVSKAGRETIAYHKLGARAWAREKGHLREKVTPAQTEALPVEKKGILARAVDGAKKAYGFAAHGVEDLAVSKSFDIEGRKAKTVDLSDSYTGKLVEEIRADYARKAVEKWGNLSPDQLEKRIASLLVRDMVDISISHFLDVEAVGLKRASDTYLQLREVAKTLSPEVRKNVWKETKKARKVGVAKSIAGISAVQVVKSPVRFLTGWGITGKIKDHLGWAAETRENLGSVVAKPDGQSAVRMMTNRLVEKDLAAVDSQPISVAEETGLQLEGKTASLAVDFTSKGGYVFEDKRAIVTEAISSAAEKASLPAALTVFRINSVSDLVQAAQARPEVANLLSTTIKSVDGPDVSKLSVGDALLSMPIDQQSKIIGGLDLAKVVTDQKLKSEFVATVKEAIAPKVLSVQVGEKGIGTLWHALEVQGVKPMEVGSANAFIKNVLPNLNVDDSVKRALTDSYSTSRPATFALLIEQNQKLFDDNRGLGIVWEGDKIGMTKSLNLEAGLFNQAVVDNQPAFKPNFLPALDATATPDQPFKYEYVEVTNPDGSKGLQLVKIPLGPSSTVGAPATVVQRVETALPKVDVPAVRWEYQEVANSDGTKGLKLVQVGGGADTIDTGSATAGGTSLVDIPADASPSPAPAFRWEYQEVANSDGTKGLKLVQVRIGSPATDPNVSKLDAGTAVTAPRPTGGGTGIEATGKAAEEMAAGPAATPEPAKPVTKIRPEDIIIVPAENRPRVEPREYLGLDLADSEREPITISPDRATKAYLQAEIEEQLKNSRLSSGDKLSMARVRDFETKAWRYSLEKPNDDEVNFTVGKRGGLIVYFHSGYTVSGLYEDMQPGEWLRQAAEGGRYDVVRFGPAQIQEHLNEWVRKQLIYQFPQLGNPNDETYQLISAKLYSYDEVQTGIFDGEKWQDHDAGPDTISIMYCGWSGSEAVRNLYTWEAYITQFAGSAKFTQEELRQAFATIKNPTADSLTFKNAMDKIIKTWATDSKSVADYNKFRWAYDQFQWQGEVDPKSHGEPNPWDKTKYWLVFKKIGGK